MSKHENSGRKPGPCGVCGRPRSPKKVAVLDGVPQMLCLECHHFRGEVLAIKRGGHYDDDGQRKATR